MQERLANALLAPLPAAGTALRLGLRNLITLALAGVRTPGGYSRHCFATEAARRVIPGLALHVDLGPHDFSGAGLGLILAWLASSTGFRVPVGGARSITQALLRRLEEAGGAVRLNSRVQKIVVQKRRAVALTTETGDEIGAARAILVDVGAPALFCKLLPESEVSWWVRRCMRRFRYGWGTVKMDWALNGPVPWRSAEARESAVVHAADSIDDLENFTHEVRSGRLPTNPYLVIGQQSLADPSR